MRFEIYLSKRFKNLKIYQEEWLLIMYYVIKHLMLLKVRNMTDINVDLIQKFLNFLIKIFLVVMLKVKLGQINSYSKIYTNLQLENSKNETQAHLLKTTSAVLV